MQRLLYSWTDEESDGHSGTTGPAEARADDSTGDAVVALDSLADPDRRRILAALAGEKRTIPELSSACDIPCSTAYRKVDQLLRGGLLEESVRIRSRGRNIREYRLRPTDVRVSVDESGVHLHLSESPTDRRLAPEPFHTGQWCLAPHWEQNR